MNIEKTVDELFKSTKLYFNALINENENNKKIFELVTEINKKTTLLREYNHVIYELFFWHTNLSSYEIYTIHDFTYIIEMIKFINELDIQINSNQLVFTKIKTKELVSEREIMIYNYKFNFGNEIEQKENQQIEIINVDYNTLFDILNEILNDKNWNDKGFIYEKLDKFFERK